MHYRKTVLWHRAMEVAQGVYGLVQRLPREEAFGVRSQITRASVSVACNVAEGWTRESRKEKAQFLAIAQGSAAELETLITLCERLGWFPESATQEVRSRLDEVSRMLTSLRRATRKA
ncbi:four helix bundle protein [Lysobacter yangpyeongensis]|uniref:Four helix bundle protein n=1 Tax=Lysobacter yangpyeongensis TaxID=346182 RepID=A0ABW0SN42_9GAMM